MIIKLNKILTILLLSVLMELSEQSMNREQSCLALKNNNKQCSYYCYNVVKPLLQYIDTIKTKNEQYDEVLVKVHDLELTVKHKESLIREKEVQLEMQLELGQVYKEKSLISEELIKEKNKQILELQFQILQYQKSKMDFRSRRKEIEDSVMDEMDEFERLISSTNNSQSNADQNNRLDSQLDNLESNKPPKIGKLKATEYVIDNSLSNNCLGKSSDVHLLKIPGIDYFAIPCDSTLAGSGWTVIQRRQDGTENFHRNWTDYCKGFGNLHKDFFIGLEKLHSITNSQPHELYIHLEDFEHEVRYAKYNNFVISNKGQGYAIKTLGEYSGNAGNALFSHLNMKFFTHDRYVDNMFNCAEYFKSGWWFNDECYQCNLNGRYVSHNVENSNAIEWRTWHFKPLKFVQMMIRPKDIK